MSLEPNPRRNDYVGDGSTNNYDYDFPISDKSQLLVKTLDADYNEAELTVDVDYTVAGVDDADGGSITLIESMLPVDLDSGVLLAIIGRRTIEQQNNIGNQGSFRPDIIEDEFDNLSIVDQEQQEQIGRCLKLPDMVKASSFDPTLPPDILDPANAGRSVIINDDNTGLELGASSSGGGNLESFANLDDSNDGDNLVATIRNYFCDVAGGSFEVNLPDPTTSSGRAIDVFNISNATGNTVTVNGAIDGGTEDDLNDGESRTYKSNGVQWRTRS